jgi:hypothetical protein
VLTTVQSITSLLVLRLKRTVSAWELIGPGMVSCRW